MATSMLAGVVMVAGGLMALSLDDSDSLSFSEGSAQRPSNSASTDQLSASGVNAATSTTGATGATTSKLPNDSRRGGDSEQGAWGNETASGLSLVVTPSKPVVQPGEAVSFSALVRDGAGAMKDLTWEFGDGTVYTAATKACSDTANRPTVTSGRTEFPADATHTYREPGKYTVRVTAQTGSRCGSNAPDDSVVTSGTVEVAGTALSNGSSLPIAAVAISGAVMPEDPHAGINISARDADGYIHKVVIDWDNGELPSVITYPLSECEDPGQRWPSSSREERANHTYAVPGTYDVTVTVTSTGCDGNAPQQAIGVLEGVTVGGVVSGAAAGALG